MPLLKICGLRHPDQAAAIAELGVDAIGVIGVRGSPRYLEIGERRRVFEAVMATRPDCLRVLVVADPSEEEVDVLNPSHGHSVVQLHGGESPERCGRLRQRIDAIFWKALRIRRPEDLLTARDYCPVVDALLLDAWDPHQRGGTGRRIPVEWLQDFRPPIPWWLAGGITAGVIPLLRERVAPDGLDVSSGVERAPGEKNLEQVIELIAQIRGARPWRIKTPPLSDAAPAGPEED